MEQAREMGRALERRQEAFEDARAPAKLAWLAPVASVDCLTNPLGHKSTRFI